MAISRQQLEVNLQNILKGDWKSKNKLFDYFNLDRRRSTKPSSEKLEQASYSFQFMSANSKAGNTYATAFLATLYDNGFGTETNKQRAFELYKQAAEQKNPWGLSALGYYYASGEIVGKHAAKALDYHLEAARQNYPVAMHRAGVIYGEKGDHENKNRLYRYAAMDGEPWALKELCLQVHSNFDINPFRHYAPKNIDMNVKVTLKEKMKVSGSMDVTDGEGYGEITTSYDATSFKVTISYTGHHNIGDNKIFSNDTIPFTYSSYYESREVADIAFEKAGYSYSKIIGNIICFPVVCVIRGCAGCISCLGWSAPSAPVDQSSCFKDDKQAQTIAKEIAWARRDHDLELSVANCIQKADEIITRRLEKAKSSQLEQKSERPGNGQEAFGSANIQRLLEEQNRLLAQIANQSPNASPLSPPPAYNPFMPNVVTVVPSAPPSQEMRSPNHSQVAQLNNFFQPALRQDPAFKSPHEAIAEVNTKEVKKTRKSKK